MPQVDLSTLTGQELRQLLDASRNRGDAALSYKILQEMAARREGRVERGSFMARRPAERRLISVDLGGREAAEEDDDDLPPMPSWRLPPARSATPPEPPPPEPHSDPVSRRTRRKAPPAEIAAAAPVEEVVDELPPEPEPQPEPRPFSMRDAHDDLPPDEDADPGDWNLRMHPQEPVADPPPRRARFGLGTGLVMGIALGVFIGWGAGRIYSEPSSPLALPTRTAAITPPPAPITPPAPATEAVTETTSPPAAPPDATAAPSANVAEAPLSPTDSAPEPAPSPAARTAEAAEPVPDRPTPAVAVAAGCAAQPTPADRTICGDPELRRLQHELRRAYAEALDAHQDRAVLRERQLAWRDSRDAVTDPDRLAQIYAQRIHKLEAATAEARRQR